METQCQVCGVFYDDSELTTATTTYSKAGEELKVTEKLYCDFCLHQVPDFVKVYGDGSSVELEPEEPEEDITAPDEGTVEVAEGEE